MNLDPATCWVFIPIVAIVMGIGAGILDILSKTLKAYFVHSEQMAALRSGSTNKIGVAEIAEFAALKEELARLRDTTTNYDLSIQHTLENVEHRLTKLEQMNSGYHVSTGQISNSEPIDATLRVGA